MRILNLVSILLFLAPCVTRGQSFTVYERFEDLETRIREASSNSTLIINFWATWCGPCVEELPSFEQLNKNFGGPNLKVWLVSLDFKSRLEKQFVPFLEKQQLKSEVILLADMDADAWIPRIDPNWEGALPATLIVRNGQRELFPTAFENYQELESFVLSFLKNLKKVAGMSTNGGSR